MAKKHRKLGNRIESLESRAMMAGDVVNAFVQQGTLYIYGTQQNDNIAVHVSDKKVEIPGVMIKNAQGQLVSSLSREEVPYQVIATGQAGDDYIAIIEEGGKPLPVVFYGNQGNDTLIGGSSDDALIGQDGFDTLVGNAGNDKLIAALYADNRDLPQSSDPMETLDGGAGNDTLYGSAGADWLSGGAGADKLFGLAGDDLLAGGDGLDEYDGGAGVDKLIELGITGNTTLTDTQYSESGSSVDEFGNFTMWGATVPLAGIEKAELTAHVANSTGVVIDASRFSGDVVLSGTNQADVLKGGRGNDTISGLGGNDKLTGGVGTNSLYGGTGVDAIFEQIGAGTTVLRDNSFVAGLTRSDLLSIESARLAEAPQLVGARLVDARGFSGKLTMTNASGTDVTTPYLIAGLIQSNYFNQFSTPENTLATISAKYESLGGATGLLGPAIRTPVSVNGVQYVRYANGAIFSSSRGTFELHGVVWQKYLSMGIGNNLLGWPTSDVNGASFNIGNSAKFERGTIIGSNAIYGKNYDQFVRGGGVATYGLPTSDPQSISLAKRDATGTAYSQNGREMGLVSRFERGSIYSSTNVPAYFVAKDFRPNFDFYWRSMGGVNSPLHLPLAAPTQIDLGNGEIGYMQRFQDGALFWSGASGYGSAQGLIYQKYMSLGGPRELGMPIGNETKQHFSTNDDMFISTFQYSRITYESALERYRVTYV